MRKRLQRRRSRTEVEGKTKGVVLLGTERTDSVLRKTKESMSNADRSGLRSAEGGKRGDDKPLRAEWCS